MTGLHKLVAAAALFAVSACAQFYSEAPIYPDSEGVAAYGADARRVRLVNDNPEDKPMKLKTVWGGGFYTHTEDHLFKPSKPTDAIKETLVPLPGLADHFISQRTSSDEAGKLSFTYDLIAGSGDVFHMYELACTDLTAEERARFNMVTPRSEPPPEAPPTQASEPPPDCLVRGRADLEAAFTLLAARKTPGAEIRITRRGKR